MIRRLLGALACAMLASAHAGEAVEVPVLALSSSPAPLRAVLFAPRGPGPHPAVVMVHGCGGAYGRDGALNPRHRMWGELLAEHGYVALMVDSFTSRGVKELCTQKTAERTLRAADRAGDAFAALAYLRTRRDVDPARVALLGWSHGGSTVLETLARRPPEGRGFSAAIAFYPGCAVRARKPEAFEPHAPLLLLVGDSDDWTPAEPCKSLARALEARGGKVKLVAYPGTYHDFDNPGLKAKRVRAEVPNGVKPGAGVTVAPNPAAREDAKRRVLDFLAAG